MKLISQGKIKCGMIGSGHMARAYLKALKELQSQLRGVELELTCVGVRQKDQVAAISQEFKREFGVKKALGMDEFWKEDFNHLFIASPCQSHLEHLSRGSAKSSVLKIYCEKPLVANAEELRFLETLTGLKHKPVQLGFQFLQIPAIQMARAVAPTLGKLLHFEGHYLKSGYLDKSYRDLRKERLLPAPCGGVTSDLGSHVLSALLYVLDLRDGQSDAQSGGSRPDFIVRAAVQGGEYADVDPRSDLYSQVVLEERHSKAIGTVTSSRIATGYANELGFALHFEEGALEFSMFDLHGLRLFTKAGGRGRRSVSDASTFTLPQALERALLGFLIPDAPRDFTGPDLQHGIQVQSLVNEAVASFGKRERV